jgi:hypothetical protein
MSFKNLLDSWRESAAQPRTAAEYAVRLPVDDAARLAALAEMFPGRTPEQLITDLLGAALQEIETSMPYVTGKKVISSDEQGDPIYEDVGLTPRCSSSSRARTAKSSRPSFPETNNAARASAKVNARRSTNVGI